MLRPMKGWQIFWNTHLFLMKATKARTHFGTHLPEPHPSPTQAHAAQVSVTLGPEQGELGANFSHLGGVITDFKKKISR
jgi:hypothetical protein